MASTPALAAREPQLANDPIGAQDRLQLAGPGQGVGEVGGEGDPRQRPVLAAEAAYDAAPYGPGCSAIEPSYDGLVGLNLLRGFRQRVKERFSREAKLAARVPHRNVVQIFDIGRLDVGGSQPYIVMEYLDGLPYRSKALSMSQDLWLSLSVAEQEDFIDELESKIRLYETFHNDMANWVRFGNAEPGDALYRVPLSTLP